MRKGFTLIEIMIVIIIVGILATMGIVQYTKAIEKARGAEAKNFLGSLRSQCGAIYLENSDTATCANSTCFSSPGTSLAGHVFTCR